MDKLVKRIGNLVLIPEGCLTVMQAAKEVGVTRQAIDRVITLGRIKPVKVGYRVFIPITSLRDYYESKWKRELTKDKHGRFVYDPSNGTYSVRQAAQYMTEQLEQHYTPNRIYHLMRRKVLQHKRHGCSYVLSREILDELVLIEKKNNITC